MPEKEQQLAAMQREYDLLARDYTDLKGKLQQSELSADVARQQEGQQFRLVDPPPCPSHRRAPSGSDTHKPGAPDTCSGTFK